jgi:rubredoxin
MKWHGLKNYYRGKIAQGQDEFFFPLEPDEDGMIGRECPQQDCQPRYFKIAPQELPPDSDDIGESGTAAMLPDHLYCPYCGHQGGLQQFTSRDQARWAQSLMVRGIQQISREILRDLYPPGPLPSVRHYAEKKLKRAVECDQCGTKYAVYGIAVFCPNCGEGNLGLHLQRSIETIKVLLSAKLEIETEGGKEAGYHLLGNCLEDCVSLFEGFLKVIYSQALQASLTPEQRQKRLRGLGNAFQNPTRAENIIKSDLGWSLFEGIEDPDRAFLELQFAKRNVITHNLSLVDERFLKQVSTWQSTGQDVEITPEEIERLLALERSVLLNSIKRLLSFSKR